MILNKEEMNKRVLQHCRTICTKVKNGTLGKNNPDASRVAAACAVVGEEHCKMGYSGDPKLVSYLPIMTNALRVLGGKIGEHSNLSNTENCTIGSCAEPHAANQVFMNHRHSTVTIKDLMFSNAYRPRTKSTKNHTIVFRDKKGNITKVEHVPYCPNCQKVFNI